MKKRLLALCLLMALCLPCFFGCGGGEPYQAVLYNKLNTDIVITLFSAGKTKSEDELVAACEALLDEAEDILSRAAAEAELARVNANPAESVTVSDTLAEVISLSLSLAKNTNGAFDPTAGALADLYNITGDTPLPPTEADVAAALATVGYHRITLTGNTLTRAPGTMLDFGAVAKGYLAASLVAYLRGEGVSGGVLSLGGNVAVFGKKPGGNPFRVAIRSPQGGAAGLLELTGEAYVSTSGAYERYRIGADGKRYHHIFDPATGRPAESGLASVTVVDENGARADALSTALYVMGWDAAIAYWETQGKDFDMLLISESGDMYATPGMNFKTL